MYSPYTQIDFNQSQDTNSPNPALIAFQLWRVAHALEEEEEEEDEWREREHYESLKLSAAWMTQLKPCVKSYVSSCCLWQKLLLRALTRSGLV